MNDLDKVYAESVAKDYMPKETNKVRQLKSLMRGQSSRLSFRL